MKKTKIIFLLVLLVVSFLFLEAENSFGAVFFQDDFNSQSSTWNIGKGALNNPPGTEGLWGFWDRQTCSSMSCADCGELPSSADGWLMFMDATGGRNGSQAIRETLRNGCSNGYPGTLQYTFTSNRQDVYIGMYMKIEEGYGKIGGFPDACKLPYRLLLENQEPIYIQYSGSSQGNGFDSANLSIYGSAFNSGEWWDTGITPADIYTDHNWHWLEFRIKLNSTGSTSDGAVQTWVDGIFKKSALNVKIYSSGTQFFDRIWIEQGNCSNTAWAQTTWKSVWFDDFTLSNTYIGPPGGGQTDTQKPIVTAFSVPASSSNLNVPVNTFMATDNVGVTGYIITEYSTAPSLSDPYWSSVPLTSYQFFSAGVKTLYAWAHDAAGNISNSRSASVTVSASSSQGNLLFSENFEDANIASRGWYDNTDIVISNAEHAAVGTKSAQFLFGIGASTPTSGGAIRKLFTPTDTVYLSFWQKYQSTWKEQQGGYGHHEILLLTDADDAWSNLAFTHLTTYLENWGTYDQAVNTVPHLDFQDGVNIDQSRIGVDLVNITENRATSGCNGNSDTHTNLSCYDSGDGTYWNGKIISAPAASFSLGDWHHVEAYIKLNSISGGKGIANGEVIYWLDGQQLFRHSNVMMRTNANPNMKFNQFIIGPYMGNGAPQTQSFYLDNLEVWDGMSSISEPAPPPSSPASLSVR